MEKNDTSKWKTEFRKNKKIKTRPPLNIQEEKLIFPPLQTIFDLPPLESEIQKETFTTTENPPTIEGMSSSGKSFQKTTKKYLNNFEYIRTYLYNAIYEYCYWFVKIDIPLLNTEKHKENPPEKEIKADAKYLQTFVISIMILILSVYASYNWYYLLFFKEGLATTLNFENYVFSNYIFNYLFGLVLTPVKLLDSLLFKWIPSLNTNVSPLQSMNLFFLIFFIFLIFYLLIESNNFNTGITAIVMAIVIIGWAQWIPITAIEWFSPPLRINFAIAVAFGIWIILRLIISISLVQFAISFIYLYLFVQSFFGVFRFEKNGLSALWGIFPYIIRKNKDFYENNKFLKFLGKFDRYIDPSILWVFPYIVLCLFYLFNLRFNISSFNLVSTMSLILLLLIAMFVSIAFVFEPKECNSGGSDTQPSVTNPAVINPVTNPVTQPVTQPVVINPATQPT